MSELESDHPRAGGENDDLILGHDGGSGSSPRGRGKPDRLQRREQGPGIIPARAGKTGGHVRHHPHGGDHPRAGGENGASKMRWPQPGGSSPRGRGKRRVQRVQLDGDRIIPARAGKTIGSSTWGCPCADHPRAGGENATPAKDSVFLNGSSPRGRGKRSVLSSLPRVLRIIPARAGKT